MANKTQAKAAIDNAVVIIKDEIDNILPVGVNIQDGRLDFAPTKGYMKMLAPDASTAETWKNTMSANLTGAGRQHTIRKEGAYAEDATMNAKEDVITITAPPFVHQIYF